MFTFLAIALVVLFVIQLARIPAAKDAIKLDKRMRGEQGQVLPFFAILLAVLAGYVWIMLQHASVYTSF